MGFQDDTSLRPVGDGAFAADVDPGWWVVRGPHGGYMAALVLRAMNECVGDPARHVRSLTTHFVAAPEIGELRLEPVIERTGSSMTYASARVTQNGGVVAIALAAFSAPWDGFDFDDAPRPEVTSLEDSFPVPREGPDIPPFLGNFDMRWAFGDAFFSQSDKAELGGWMRFLEPEVLDAPGIACFMDAWAPVVFPRAPRPLVCPTIDLTVHFRRPLPLDGIASDDFFLGRFSSKLSHEGLFEEDGELWDAKGRLVAQSRQLAIAMWMKERGS